MALEEIISKEILVWLGDIDDPRNETPQNFSPDLLIIQLTQGDKASANSISSRRKVSY